MAKREKGTKPTWSVTRIKHPSYPKITGRVGEFQAGGMLHFFRKVNGKQKSESPKLPRWEILARPTPACTEAESV
jgi:hypothetical protein